MQCFSQPTSSVLIPAWLSSYSFRIPLQVQKWVPFADRRLSLQILIGYNNVAINAQWQGSQADALAELQQSGILGITTGLYVSPWQCFQGPLLTLYPP